MRPNKKEDRQPARSKKSFIGLGDRGAWVLEIRSEDHGAGSRRLGELVLRGTMSGTLSAEIRDAD